ncbi:MAG: hypothetical protein RLZZ59_827 [Pseudomonadota bacterium]|jgi:outer membrane lipoprotein-sorting protein
MKALLTLVMAVVLVPFFAQADDAAAKKDDAAMTSDMKAADADMKKEENKDAAAK